MPSLGGLGAGCLEESVDNHLGGLVPVGLHAGAAAILSGNLHRTQNDSAASVCGFNLCGGYEFHKFNPFVEGHLHLVAERRHILATPPIEDHGPAAETNDAPGHVDGRVAAPDDGGGSLAGRRLSVTNL